MKKLLIILLFLFPLMLFAQEEKVEETEINKDIFLKINKSIRLDLPKDTVKTGVIWSSSNEQIATVDEDGVVVGKAAGEVVVTANTSEGYEIEYNVKVATTVPYYFTIALNWVKQNLIIVEIIAVLGLIFVFIKLAY